MHGAALGERRVEELLSSPKIASHSSPRPGKQGPLTHSRTGRATMTEAGRSFYAPLQILRSNRISVSSSDDSVGHDGIDVNEWLVALVEQLKSIPRPRQLIFVGSSGGGYAALQLSRRFPGSLAFVTDPQTIIPTNYYATQVKRLMHVGFDDLGVSKSALDAHPERLSAVESYTQTMPDNWISYSQHLRDRFHVENHLRPFAGMFGIAEPTSDQETDQLQAHGIRARQALATYSSAVHGTLDSGDRVARREAQRGNQCVAKQRSEVRGKTCGCIRILVPG